MICFEKKTKHEKLAFLVKYDIKNGYYDSFLFKKMYTFINYNKSLKVTAFDIFLFKWVDTPHKDRRLGHV